MMGTTLPAVRHEDADVTLAEATRCDDALTGICEETGDEPDMDAVAAGGVRADGHELLDEGDVREESVSRFNRFRSPRNSAAV